MDVSEAPGAQAGVPLQDPADAEYLRQAYDIPAGFPRLFGQAEDKSSYRCLLNVSIKDKNTQVKMLELVTRCLQ